MNATIKTILEREFPKRDITGIAEQSGSEQPGNRMVAVQFRYGKQIFLKVAIDGGHRRIRRDTAATRYAARHCDVRVPRAAAADPDAKPPYVATTPHSGTALDSVWGDSGTEKRQSLLRYVGRGVAGVHAAQFDESGHVLDGDSASLELDTGPWTEVLCEELDRRANQHLPNRFGDTLERVTQGLRSHCEYLDTVSPVFLHGDPRPENCFLNGDPGFID